MSMRLSVSVVVPVYNRADMLPFTLDAIMSQTYYPNEIIVVNDGSTDETSMLLENYKDVIEVIEITNSGDMIAKNTGLHASNSQLVAFCDSDDLWKRKYLERMCEFWQIYPDLVAAYSDFIEVKNDQWSSQSKFDAAPKTFWGDWRYLGNGYMVRTSSYVDSLMGYQPFFPSCLVVDREKFIGLGGWDESVSRMVGCDFATHLRIAAHPPVGVLKHALVGIRKHASNYSGDNLKMALGDAGVLKKILVSQPEMNEYKKDIENSISERLRAAIEIAFTRGDMDIVKRTANMVDANLLSNKQKIKVFVAHMPLPLGHIVWRLVSIAGTVRRRLVAMGKKIKS